MLEQDQEEETQMETPEKLEKSTIANMALASSVAVGHHINVYTLQLTPFLLPGYVIGGRALAVVRVCCIALHKHQEIFEVS